MRIFSIKDLETRFPDLFNRIKGYVLLAGALRSLRIVTLRSDVKLQRFLDVVEEIFSAIPRLCNSSIRPLIDQTRQLVQGNPELLDAKKEVTFGQDMAKHLAELMLALFGQIRHDVRNVLYAIASEMLGDDVETNAIEDAIVKIEHQLTQIAVKNAANPEKEPEVPSFAEIIRGSFEVLRQNEFVADSPSAPTASNFMFFPPPPQPAYNYEKDAPDAHEREKHNQQYNWFDPKNPLVY